ncbi:MAG TPA: CHAT domain-containing protein, partial [Actinoplanes sp.]|nr:CHAT domain-containing protein [Actinoplanes sp.]
ADPLLSGLELADGVVTVEDFLERGAAAKLMVLSACLTGFSGQRAGDELVGLARAALSNGGRTVVATLWSVSDESSETFFRYFYGALMRGASVSHALFFAQDTMPVEHPELGEPFDWAPYCLIGDPDTRIQDA